VNRLISYLFCLILLLTIPTPLRACTIFCAKDQHGQVWAANNEDFYFFDFSTWIRVRPVTDSTLSFLYFGYPDTKFPQGGVNEAGLFYDANAVEPTKVKDPGSKIPFPGEGEHAMMLYILGHCKTVPEAIDLFRKYHTPWMAAGQINIADKVGNMGIITADSAWLTPGNFQVSTNYNLSHNDDDYKNCWRYPIAHSMLSTSEPSLELMTLICDSTSQRAGASTIYSNIHNLSTGEMWLYYSWDYERPYKTTFKDMMALGDTTILFRDLFSHQPVTQAYNAFKANGFGSGLEILNSIKDPELRKEKLKLLSLNALYDFSSFVESGKVLITGDEKLIAEVIGASNNEEVLSHIANQNISAGNKKLASQKLRMIKGSGISDTLLSGIVVSGVVIGLWFFIRKFRKTSSQR
jgi:hypothetical protein